MDTEIVTPPIDTSLTPEVPMAETPSPSAKAPHPTDPHRWADGTLRPGNVAALVHGARSRQASALQAPLREELRQQVLADLGAEDGGLAVTLLRLVDRFVEVSLLCDSYIAWLEDQGGPIGTRGRQRAAVGGYLAALDRQMKLASLIGLERRARQLSTASPAAYLAAQARPGGQS